MGCVWKIAKKERQNKLKFGHKPSIMLIEQNRHQCHFKISLTWDNIKKTPN